MKSRQLRALKFLAPHIALGSESSRERKFHPWNFRSRERKYVGTKVPVTWSINYFVCLAKVFSTPAPENLLNTDFISDPLGD